MSSPVKRPRTSCVSSEWEVEANRHVAIWRQQLPGVKAGVYSFFLLNAAKKQGIDLETMQSEDVRSLSAYRNVVKEVEAQMSKWEEKMRLVEPIVHAKALIEAAERAGVCLGQVAFDPLSLYLDRRRKCADVGVQADAACPVCTSFVDDLDSVSAYDNEWYRILLNYQMLLSIY